MIMKRFDFCGQVLLYFSDNLFSIPAAVTLAKDKVNAPGLRKKKKIDNIYVDKNESS